MCQPALVKILLEIHQISLNPKNLLHTIQIYRKAFAYCNAITSGVQWESCNHLKLQEEVIYQEHTADSSHFLHNPTPEFLQLSK